MIMKTIEEIYKNYPNIPYISPERDLAEINFSKVVPRKNMEETSEGLLPGDIILLWRIQFGTFTTETSFSKYFEYIYGINRKEHLEFLIKNGFVRMESPLDSLDHLSAPLLKLFLKEKNVKGLSKMKRSDLDQAIAIAFTEEELGKLFVVRGLALTEKGLAALSNNQEVIDRHPKKKF
ncbi:hypothetical protein SAG0046_10500 [Streptococcus agalactiae FSL S3-005]|uniref:hypothetical protein n=1 Tax=Streptococcus agalactiae TaxID=1311 RepID=UPI00030C805E|nr:hypothetical protein [Streptococcus agalactiae]EPW11397.1 hypothetical protein SAG0046_10500 [Streptococcus agalactiae FSL S3-005]